MYYSFVKVYYCTGGSVSYFIILRENYSSLDSNIIDWNYFLCKYNCNSSVISDSSCLCEGQLARSVTLARTERPG